MGTSSIHPGCANNLFWLAVITSIIIIILHDVVGINYSYSFLALGILLVTAYLSAYVFYGVLVVKNKRRIQELQAQTDELQRQRQSILQRIEKQNVEIKQTPYRSLPSMTPAEFVRWRIEQAPDDSAELRDLAAVDGEIQMLEAERLKLLR